MSSPAPARGSPSRLPWGRPLYEPLSWGVIRSPLLPVDAYPRAAADGRGDEGLLPADPLARAALAVGTADLSAALQRPYGDARDAARLRSRVLRYVIRMTTRPTPFGLFAGAGLVEWA